MTIKKLYLKNFRNYKTLDIDFSKDMNIIYGENAQGKTNILEAIFLCSTGRSHRTQRDAELIMYGENFLVVELTFVRENFGEMVIGIEIQRGGRKSIKINGVPQRRAGDLLGNLNCVIFSPEDLSVIKDEPQVRRRFLDMFISQIKPAYYFNLHSYIQALRQRNALLRKLREEGEPKRDGQTYATSSVSELIAPWNETVASFGAKIMRERVYFIDRLCKYAVNNHKLITNDSERLAIKYMPSVSGCPDSGAGTDAIADSEAEAGVISGADTLSRTAPRDAVEAESALYTAFIKALSQNISADISRMTTQAGPHKDDVSVMIDGKNARIYSSQGQQRTAALALKMAQTDVMSDETGNVPVLLLDDVMSELDDSRRQNLISQIKGSQTFITGTSRESSPDTGIGATSWFYIDGGKTSKHREKHC